MDKSTVNSIKGLSNEEVRERVQKGLVNVSSMNETKSYKKIIYDNIFTLFNFVNIVLACIIIPTGSYRNLLFLGVVVSNFVIGTFQEIRAKIVLDKIAVVVSLKAHVIRDGNKQNIPVDEVVKDDVLQVTTGDQVVSDAVLLQGLVEVDESLLTGESDIIKKKEGDMLYSGSFVVGGTAYLQVVNVGDDNYASKITSGARKFKRYPSQLRDTLNKIIKIIGILIIPLGLAMFFQSYVINHHPYVDSVLSISAALIGMIPEGLVILTSIALAVGAMNLARHKTLVQELYCLETLARVDTLCLDKTGTITEGKMEVVDVIMVDEETPSIIGNYLSVMKEDNPTYLAMEKHFEKHNDYEYVSSIPFSSKRKYSAVNFKQGTYILGAYEFTMKDDTKYKQQIEDLTGQGYRVLVLSKSCDVLEDEITCVPEMVALVVLNDKIREDAVETFAYFMKQGITLKVISGDNPLAVSKIAKRAGIANTDAYVDVYGMSDEELKEAVSINTVFGRVSPQQKQYMVECLKEANHTVAMSGDGVNDVLAFKSSNISIAMASGSDVSKASANLVLLDNNFNALPYVLNEGRRVINNIERVATLFLTKTIFSFLLSICALCFNISYPLIPIQLTMISSLTIGIPAFVLALEPNHERVKGKFLENIIKVSLPSAISMVIALIFLIILTKTNYITKSELQQLTVLTAAINGIIVLIKVARPFSRLRILLISLMSIALIICFMFFYDFFGLKSITILPILLPLAISIGILLSVSYIGGRIITFVYHYRNKP